MQAIMEIAEDHDLAVIEDACQAHGAGLNGKRVGSFGTGAFSFYPTKNMTTSEGGMITTDDVQVAEKARMIRAHGSKQRYMHELMGYNYRMTDIAAAIGLVQLNRIEEFNSARQKNASVLSDGLRDLDYITTPVVREGCEHVYHQYTVRTENRDALADYLKDNGVGCGIYYPIPIHQQPLYRDLSYTDNLPETEKAAGEVLSLPVHPALDEKDIEHIITTIKNWE
jgi:dTDP-4-amino-4,6-dideoxygalactose transaminase